LQKQKRVGGTHVPKRIALIDPNRMEEDISMQLVDCIDETIRGTKESGRTPIYTKREINPNLNPKFLIDVIRPLLHKSSLLQILEHENH
jgi:hypothetical protein